MALVSSQLKRGRVSVFQVLSPLTIFIVSQERGFVKCFFKKNLIFLKNFFENRGEPKENKCSCAEKRCKGKNKCSVLRAKNFLKNFEKTS